MIGNFFEVLAYRLCVGPPTRIDRFNSGVPLQGANVSSSLTWGRKFSVVITGRTSPFFIGGMGQWWSPALQAVREISMGVRVPLPPPEEGDVGSNPTRLRKGLVV